jgi:hypothetical protein
MIDACIVRFGPTRRALLVMLLAIAVCAGLTALLFVVMADAYRSGEHGFRSYSFEIAWKDFLRSPVWGEWFQGSSTIINPYLPGERVAVHNDVLDIMRQGGVIALSCFLAATLWPILVLARHCRHWRLAPAPLKSCAAAIIGSYAIFLFNPVLLTPDVAVVLWVVVACGLWHCHAFAAAISAEETASWHKH